MTNVTAQFETKIYMDTLKGVAYINAEGKDGYIQTFETFKEQIKALNDLKKRFQVIVPKGSDLAEVAGFRTELKQRRAKSDRQRLIDRVARIRCGLPWDMSRQYNFEGDDLNRWNAERESLKSLNLDELKQAEGASKYEYKLRVNGIENIPEDETLSIKDVLNTKVKAGPKSFKV